MNDATVSGTMQQEDQEKTETTAPEEQETWPLRMPLSRPLRVIGKGGDKMIEEIEFREPTGMDIAVCGCPVYVTDWDRGVINIDAAKMAAMISRLSGIPPAFVNQMNSRDWTTCAVALQRFFLPDLGRLLS